MTEEERKDGLESLFRNKLEENEMVAGSDLKDRVMGRLERREFFRFNLLRFNIYYLTAALAALTVAVLILIPVPGATDESAVPGLPQETVTTVQSVVPVPQGVAPPESVTLNAADTTPESAAAAAENPGKQLISEPSPGKVTDREPAIAYSRHIADTVKVSTVGTPVTAGIGQTARATGTAGTYGTAGITGNEGMATAPAERGLSIECSVTSGCVPLHVSFVCNAEEKSNISWNFGDGGTSSLKNPDYIFDIPGTYRVTLTVTGSRGYLSAANVIIEVWERPRAAFEVRKDDPFDEGDRVVFVNLSAGAVDYLWDFGDGVFSTLADPVYRYEHMGTYDVRLVAWSAEGCSDSVTVSDLFTDKGMYIRFPNAFVPATGGPTGGYYNIRTDEESAVFHPVASGIADYNLKIYSKAGLLVFESNETGIGWDGYYRGELCAPGVYVWKVRGTYRNGQPFIMAGDVTLLRY